MANDRKIVFILLPLVSALVIGLFLSGSVSGAAVIIDDEMYTPSEPAHSDALNITVDVVMVDAEPVENGVVLKWSLCTESSCNLPNTFAMTNLINGKWSARIGPFPEEDMSGNPYVDVRFHVEVTAAPIGGGEEFREVGKEVTLYFMNTTGGDDDTGTNNTSGDDDTNDSPVGIGVIVSGAVAAGILGIRRRKNPGNY